MKSEPSPQASPAMRDLFDGDEVRHVLRETFYRPGADEGVAESAAPPRRRRRRRSTPKADHYEVICISMYKEDLARLDAAVADLKREGHRKMSRSALIRFALSTMDRAGLPDPL